MKGRQEGIITDGSVGPAVLSISTDGKLLALGKHDQQVDLVDAISGHTMATWTLSRFAHRTQ